MHIFAKMSCVILDIGEGNLYYLMVKGNGISEISIFHLNCINIIIIQCLCHNTEKAVPIPFHLSLYNTFFCFG